MRTESFSTAKERNDRVAELKVLRNEQGREACRFFRINQTADPIVIGLIALKAFGGLRTSAMLRLRAEDFKKSPRGLLNPAVMIKKQRRYFVENYPENFWKWVDWLPKDAFELNEQQYHGCDFDRCQFMQLFANRVAPLH